MGIVLHSFFNAFIASGESVETLMGVKSTIKIALSRKLDQ